MTPIIGDIVHYAPYAARFKENGMPADQKWCHPAIVTAVFSDELVNLVVFESNGTCVPVKRIRCGGGEGHTWHVPQHPDEI